MVTEAIMPPVHPGEALLEFLNPLSLSQYQLAKEIGVPARRRADSHITTEPLTCAGTIRAGDGNRNRMTSLEDRSRSRALTCANNSAGHPRWVPVSNRNSPMGTLAYGTYVARGNCRASGITAIHRPHWAPTRQVAHGWRAAYVGLTLKA
jgi:hypothetical protein